ncbi:MAG: DUF3078 domain-containing protein [Porphyromonadaceae bacterium]|nr:DUF3078 domain-containing protein [Porphyromonadaceae bacterium]
MIGLVLALPARAIPKAPVSADPSPWVAVQSADSLERLRQNIFSLIDSLERKGKTRVDTTQVSSGTATITTTVSDFTIAEELLHTLDSVIETNIPEIVEAKPDSSTTPTLPTRKGKVSASHTRPLEMCDQAKAILEEAQKDSVSEPEGEIPVNPIFMPIVFNGQRASSAPTLQEKPVKEKENKYTPYAIKRRENSIDRDRKLAEVGAYAQEEIILDHPERIHYTPEKLPPPIRMEHMKKHREMLTMGDFFPPREFDVQGRPIKLKHWISSLYSSLQVSQIYISDNWYQGGSSNINLISAQSYSLNYKDYKDVIIFENTLKWNLNISTAPDDTLRKYSISEDLVRFDTKFSYKAFKSLYYTTSMYFKTQIFNNYKKNTDTRTSSFLSSGELSYNLGMSYNLTSKDKSFTLSITGSPFSYNLKTCIDPKVDETNFSIEEGKRTSNKFGSSFETNIKWQFMRNMYVSSRLYYFTSYNNVQMDFENTFNFVLNRYFSTRIEVKTRYDDSVSPNSRGSYFQVKELLSFGFAFKI